MEYVVMFYPEDSCLCIRKADYPRMARKAGLQAQDLSWERWVAHRAAGRKVLIVNAIRWSTNVAEMIALGMTERCERLLIDLEGVPAPAIPASSELLATLRSLLPDVEVV